MRKYNADIQFLSRTDGADRGRFSDELSTLKCSQLPARNVSILELLLSSGTSKVPTTAWGHMRTNRIIRIILHYLKIRH